MLFTQSHRGVVLKTKIFTGSAIAIVTPFTADGSKVNYAKLEEIIDYQICNGTDAIVVCGTTGEAPTLEDPEHVECIRTAVKAASKRVPVIAGTGSNFTAHAVWMSNEAEKCGADALLCVTPYYNKTSQDGLITHYNFLADNTNLPMIVYNVPSRTGVNIAPSTYFELSKHPRINGIKEASGNLSEFAKTVALCGDTLNYYSGNDDQIVPIMSLGGSGVISVFAHVAPKIAHDIPTLYLEGKTNESAKLQLEWLDLCNALFCDVNPIPVKAALNLMGFDVGPCRLPLDGMNEKNLNILKTALKNHGLI